MALLDGEDIEFFGRLAKFPELELFVKVYYWNQDITQVLNSDGINIYGYKFTSEYKTLNGIKVSSSIIDDYVLF